MRSKRVGKYGKRKNLKTTTKKHPDLLYLSLPMALLFLSLIFYFKPVFTSTIENEDPNAIPHIQVFRDSQLDQPSSPRESVVFENSDIKDDFISIEQIDDLTSAEEEEESVENASFKEYRPLEFKAYRIREGDSLWRIAKRFGLSVDTIISRNNFNPLDVLSPGEVIQIPNLNGIFHKVRSGDTLSILSRKYRIPVASIEAYLPDKNVLKKGEVIFLPHAKFSNPKRERLFGGFFITPVKGYLTSKYGLRLHPIKKRKLFHSGADIGGNKGEPVYAAASGEVIYAGKNGNYGNYVQIKHTQGYTSCYAHLGSVSVRAGQRVKRSQVIGKVGSTGLSTGPHLHFEIKQHGRFINPLRFIKVAKQKRKS